MHYCALQEILWKFSQSLNHHRLQRCSRGHFPCLSLEGCFGPQHYRSPFLSHVSIMPCAPLKLRIQRGSQGWEATASWSQDVGNEGMAKEQQEQRGEDAEGLPRPIQHRNFDGSPPKFQYKSHSSETPQFSAKPLLSSGTHSQCYEKQQQHPYPIPLKPSLLFPLAPLYKPSPLAGTLQTPASWARWKVMSWDISATLGQLFRNHVWHKYLFFPPLLHN